MKILAIIIGKLINLQRKLEERRKQLEEQPKRNKENIMITIMTREETHEFLKNRKVYVENKSEEIQKKLFEAGFEWASGVKIQHLDKPYLFIDEENIITQSSDTIFFYSESKHQKITAKEILDIEIEEEYQFKPFDRILWRDGSYDYWRAGIYSHSRCNQYYIIGQGYVRYCNVIPYEGNEDKLGKVS